MLDVSAVNAYVVWQQLQGENSSYFSKKKSRKFLIQLAKGLAGMLPRYINHAALPQNKRKRAETKDQQPKPKKAGCHLCDRSKDKKCKQTCIACKKNVCQEILGQIPPDKYPPDKYPPDIYPPDNYPPCKIPPGHIPTTRCNPNPNPNPNPKLKNEFQIIVLESYRYQDKYPPDKLKNN